MLGSTGLAAAAACGCRAGPDVASRARSLPQCHAEVVVMFKQALGIPAGL